MREQAYALKRVGDMRTIRQRSRWSDASTSVSYQWCTSTVDALLMELPERRPDELSSRQGKVALKRWLLEVTQGRLFSEGEARGERVYLDPLFLQATGAK